jgi:ferric-dicitrate binding protein FerR (iron transport regulator)
MEMSADRLWYLFARTLTGEASLEERQEFDQLCEQHASLRPELETLRRIWEMESGRDADYLEATYLLHIERMRKAGKAPGSFSTDPVSIGASPSPHFARKRLQTVAWVGLFIVSVFSAWLFRQFSASGGPQAEVSSANNEILTRNGHNTRFKLPDGSTVWLNAGSRLTYGRMTNTRLREVHLTGEAFFDIVKDPRHPFVIHAGKVEVKVLGTVFNVRAYPEDDSVETSLISGQVEVTVDGRPDQAYVLSPNQKLVLRKSTVEKQESGTSSAATSRLEPIIRELNYLNHDSLAMEASWVRNILSFKDEPFVSVTRRMERFYDASITFSNKGLQDLHLTGSFENETLAQAMDALRLTANFQYRIDGKKVVIY